MKLSERVTNTERKGQTGDYGAALRESVLHQVLETPSVRLRRVSVLCRLVGDKNEERRDEQQV